MVHYVLKFLLKKINKKKNTQLISQNVALWDINIPLWVIFLFIVTKIFHF